MFKKLFRDSIYSLLDSDKDFPVIGEDGENYTNDSNVLEEIKTLDGWYKLEHKKLNIVDEEKFAYESEYIFTDGKQKYLMSVPWENRDNIPMLDNKKPNDFITLRII